MTKIILPKTQTRDAVPTREQRVEEFLNCARAPSFEVVWTCLAEENLELQEAAGAFHEVLADSPDDADLMAAARADFVKEMADVQYVLSQLAVFYNVDLEDAFNRVADSNMTKVIDGQVIYREDGKIMKGSRYKAPDMRGL